MIFGMVVFDGFWRFLSTTKGFSKNHVNQTWFLVCDKGLDTLWYMKMSWGGARILWDRQLPHNMDPKNNEIFKESHNFGQFLDEKFGFWLNQAVFAWFMAWEIVNTTQ